MRMKTYLIEADAPLVFRSGKPFGTGSRDGARYPWPSAIAGALRTACYRSAPDSTPGSLLNLSVQGPLLVRRQAGVDTLMVPAPEDAIALLPDGQTTPRIYRLQPGQWPEGCGSNLPEGLQPVMLQSGAPHGKPQPMARFWPLADLLAWDRDSTRVSGAMLNGTSPLDHSDIRTHVAIDARRQAAAQGKLFQIQSIDFGVRRAEAGFDRTTWALALRSPETFAAQTLTLGGERRTARLEPVAEDPLALPEDHQARLQGADILVLTLLTPACWASGWARRLPASVARRSWIRSRPSAHWPSAHAPRAATPGRICATAWQSCPMPICRMWRVRSTSS